VHQELGGLLESGSSSWRDERKFLGGVRVHMESPIFSRTHPRTDETKAELMKDFFFTLILGRDRDMLLR
jgi:hypothetical protein